MKKFVLLACLGAMWSSVVWAEDAAPKASETPAAAATEAKPAEPFAFADFSWIPGNYGPSESVLASKYFVPELRLDTAYHYSFNNPADDTIGGFKRSLPTRRIPDHPNRSRR